MANEKENEGIEKKVSFKPVYLLTILIIMLISFGAAYLVGKTLNSSSANNIQDSAPKGEENSELGPLFSCPEFTVNIANSNGRRFLMTQFSLEVTSKKTLQELEESLPVIQDKVIILLSSQTVEDLSSIDGKEMIKSEIKESINNILSQGEVINIYFNKFVWQ